LGQVGERGPSDPKVARRPFHTQTARTGKRSTVKGAGVDTTPSGTPGAHGTTRREFIARAGLLGLGAATYGAIAGSAAPARGASPTAVDRRHGRYPDIQFDIGDYIGPVTTTNGVAFRFGPTYVLATTFRLTRTPSIADHRRLHSALERIESDFPFAPAGVFTVLAYGTPYFDRLDQAVVAAHLPRLRDDERRFAFEEAVPAPTDVARVNRGIRKRRFHVPVVIERNDLLVQFRSDSTTILHKAAAIVESQLHGLAEVTSRRMTFTKPGLPRTIADVNGLPYARRINSESPMWMGFADQQVAGAGPAEIATFVGNASARVTTARAGDYFDNGSVLHQSHVIEDLEQFYAHTSVDQEPFTERCQYMFRSDPIPAVGRRDQYSDGGGPACIPNTYQGPYDALANADRTRTFTGEPRSGHLSSLQQSSRAADGTPMHVRADGPGFDAMDIPGRTHQPKLQFAIFVPSAEFFRVMRVNQANLAIVRKYNVEPNDNGLERFLTATRRQNFLVPPRRHRVFPLLRDA
jgi:hypothetical protein